MAVGGEIAGTIETINREIGNQLSYPAIKPFLGGSVITDNSDRGIAFVQLVDKTDGQIVNFQLARADGTVRSIDLKITATLERS